MGSTVGLRVGIRVGMTAPDSASRVDQGTQEGQVERALRDIVQPPHCQYGDTKSQIGEISHMSHLFGSFRIGTDGFPSIRKLVNRTFWRLLSSDFSPSWPP